MDATLTPPAPSAAHAAPATAASPATLAYLLRLGDACLIHGQRLAEWCGHAPVLEEDIALANIALDHIGQARALLTLAGTLEGRGRDEDALAYQRIEPEFLNPTLLELPHAPPGSTEPCFGRTLVRAALWSAFATPLWQALTGSNDPTLAGIAAKAVKESRYHQRHAGDWVVRLGDGSDESHRRMQAALDALWPYTAELFDADAVDAAAEASGLGPSWARLEDAWRAELEPLFARATLVLPPPTPFRSHGKQGRHSEHMGHLLAEMQSLARAYPGAVW
jgi:ring-1,2-phenylacetyl-CoA epoxidase subunit PaaC